MEVEVTPEAMRIAIAEMVGFRRIGLFEGSMELMGELPPCRGLVRIPDYCNDLNACHKLAEFEDDTFLENLATVVSGTKCYKVSEANPWNFFEATALQICEAACRTWWPERFND